MITDNMNYSEIAKEFKYDWSNKLYDRIGEILRNQSIENSFLRM